MATGVSTGARAHVYALLAELLSFPTPQLATTIASGEVAHTLHLLSGRLPYELPVELEGLSEAIEGPELEQEYIRLFDLPGGGPTCPLYSGVYARNRRDAMEEILRFYRFFGLTMANNGRDLPDAVPTLLEFLQFLVVREESRPEESEAAERDVLGRHLLPWAAATAGRLPKRRPGAFYRDVVALAHGVAAAELEHLGAAAARGTSNL